MTQRRCPNHHFPLFSIVCLVGCQLEHDRSLEYSLNSLNPIQVLSDTHSDTNCNDLENLTLGPCRGLDFCGHCPWIRRPGRAII
ncbi:hypothetical protein Taro_026494 [Colocasia esculenta]|uniref:Uncharacterized protein n=1 Tax=Colocasia esculenta TaxID=4460 RepID=A0A843VNR4_COLES|nr:hypothetical protein [Colocasia esculenta]